MTMVRVIWKPFGVMSPPNCCFPSPGEWTDPGQPPILAPLGCGNKHGHSRHCWGKMDGFAATSPPAARGHSRVPSRPAAFHLVNPPKPGRGPGSTTGTGAAAGRDDKPSFQRFRRQILPQPENDVGHGPRLLPVRPWVW